MKFIAKENKIMKCKDCQYCSQRGGYQYFFCDRDNTLINQSDYYGGKKMDCVMNRLDEDDFTDNYMMWMIARK
jgi:hypothetical protein